MTESRPADGASFDDDAVEALLSGTDGPDSLLGGALAELRGAARRPAPEPSAALAQLLGRDDATDELSARRRRRGIVVGVVVFGASATMALSGVAAAHDALPGPAQGVISGIINDLTPFRIDGDRQAPPTPAPIATATPTDGARPTDTGLPAPGADEPVSSGAQQRGRGGSDGGTGDDRAGGDSGGGGSRDGSGSTSGDSDGGSGRDGGSGSGDGGSAGGSVSSTPSPSQSTSGSDGGSGGGSDGGSGGGSDGGSGGGGSSSTSSGGDGGGSDG